MLQPRDVTLVEQLMAHLELEHQREQRQRVFRRLLLGERAAEALLFPFWGSCIALAASLSSFWRARLAAFSALSFSLTSLSLSLSIRLCSSLTRRC
jgi:hypothetical protein